MKVDGEGLTKAPTIYHPKQDLLLNFVVICGFVVVVVTVMRFYIPFSTFKFADEINSVFNILCIVCGVFGITGLILLVFLNKYSSVPRRYQLENDLHELLVTQGLIDGKDIDWVSSINLTISRKKHVAIFIFRIRNPKATVEFFQSLHISETGSFDGCTVDYVKRQGSNIVWELVFEELEKCYV